MPFILLLLVFRIHLMIPISPVNHVNSDYYHGRKTWSNEITAAAVGKPVIFVEDFKESSIYSFYSGKTAVAVFPGQNRKSQYDIWNYQDSIRQKDVLMVHVSHFNGARELYTSIGRKYYISEISNYSSYYSILVRTASLQRQEMIRTKDR